LSNSSPIQKSTNSPSANTAQACALAPRNKIAVVVRIHRPSRAPTVQ
jgi:hypothetical protein